MDELLKKCYGGLFKVGDKVRIRRDIKDLAELKRADIDRYAIIFPNKIQESQKSLYKISYGMVVSAGKTAEVTEIIPNPSGAPLLSTMYRLKISGSYSEWCWKHALLEKVEEDVETDGSKWELPFKVGTKVKITPSLKAPNPKEGNYKHFDIGGKHYRDVGIVAEMERYKGKEATITSVYKVYSDVVGGGYDYSIEVDGEKTVWSWDVSMFDGFDAWKDKQEKDEKRDSGGSTRFPLKVGDVVTIRRDIAEKCDKSGYVWSTVNGQKFKSAFVTSTMRSLAGMSFKIGSIAGCGLDATYILDDARCFCWNINHFEEFHDYKAWVEGKGGEKKAQPPKKRRGDCYGDSQEIIDDVTGIEIDFFAYDYKGRKREFSDINGFITKIDVTIISGDETGLIYFVKDGKANRMAFDASVGTRFISYDDGTYTVEGKDNIKRWLSWSYDKDKAKNVNYAIQHMMDFLGGDK